ncbi:AI-2E family transporter [Rhizobium ruizarguesonis]
MNTLYAVPISMGLWALGIPNAILWGLLTLVLRFVPYIGAIIGMILPLFLALAIAPGWSVVIWVGALYLTTELISNNVLEPWLYGANTGLSPLAIIISAIFWSWLWGPLGLMLSTPLTVCLVVLGRHVPQFGVLDVLLGNEPVLEPHEKLYQRLLAGDPNEASDNAEEFLQEEYLVDYYDNEGLPALLLGETDRQRGVLSENQIILVASSSLSLVENLSDIAEEEENEDETASDAGLERVPNWNFPMARAGPLLIVHRRPRRSGRCDRRDAFAGAGGPGSNVHDVIIFRPCRARISRFSHRRGRHGDRHISKRQFEVSRSSDRSTTEATLSLTCA